jgi:hypothetical protein
MQIWCSLATTLNITQISKTPHSVAAAQGPDGHRLNVSGTIRHTDVDIRYHCPGSSGLADTVSSCGLCRYTTQSELQLPWEQRICVCLGINGNRIIRGQWKIQIHQAHERERKWVFGVFSFQLERYHGMRARAGPFTAVQNHLVIGLVIAEDQQVCLWSVTAHFCWHAGSTSSASPYARGIIHLSFLLPFFSWKGIAALMLLTLPN